MAKLARGVSFTPAFLSVYKVRVPRSVRKISFHQLMRKRGAPQG